MSVDGTISDFANRLGFSGQNYTKKNEEPKTDIEHKHKGYYCMKCKKQVFPAKATESERSTTNNKIQSASSCAKCGAQIRRFVKFSKEPRTIETKQKILK